MLETRQSLRQVRSECRNLERQIKTVAQRDVPHGFALPAFVKVFLDGWMQLGDYVTPDLGQTNADALAALSSINAIINNLENMFFEPWFFNRAQVFLAKGVRGTDTFDTAMLIAKGLPETDSSAKAASELGKIISKISPHFDRDWETLGPC